MLIHIRSGHCDIQGGNVGLLRWPQVSLTESGEEQCLSLDEEFILAECLAPNTFSAPLIAPGTYWASFYNCTISHRPSGQTGLFCNVMPLPLVVTVENSRAESVDLEVAGESLLKITLFKNGAPVPHARILLGGEMVTAETGTDDRGGLLLIDDPHDLLAIDFDRSMIPEILLYDGNRTKVLTFRGHDRRFSAYVFPNA